jgi:2-methylcitrate dehydratase PrpD
MSMTDHSGLTHKLARFVAETRSSDIPERVGHETKRSILNFMGTAFAGCREEPVEIALSSLTEFSRERQATVIGRTERVDALSAAFLNAASGNVFDFDDTHLRTVIHPTAPVAPALFALGEMRRVSGSDLLLAFVLGVELECRIGNAISPAHYARGWHITSTCGVFGSAAAAGKVLGLDAEQMVWAIGTAATQSSGLVECLGTAAKSVSVGNAARQGLWSALLAQRGFKGPSAPLEGPQGFFTAMGVPPDRNALTEGLGETWELLQNAYKPYPCGVVLHPVIDAVLELRAEHAVALATVSRIVVRGHPLLSARADRPHVTTGREAQVSVQHSVAAALLFRRAGLAQFTDDCVRDPAVLALRAKVEVVQDPAIAVDAAAVQICNANGEELSVMVPHARGSVARPMSDRDIEEKVLTLAAGWRADHDVRPLIDAVWALDRAEDASALLRLTIPASH